MHFSPDAPLARVGRRESSVRSKAADSTAPHRTPLPPLCVSFTHTRTHTRTHSAREADKRGKRPQVKHTHTHTQYRLPPNKQTKEKKGEFQRAIRRRKRTEEKKVKGHAAPALREAGEQLCLQGRRHASRTHPASSPAFIPLPLFFLASLCCSRLVTLPSFLRCLVWFCFLFAFTCQSVVVCARDRHWRARTRYLPSSAPPLKQLLFSSSLSEGSRERETHRQADRLATAASCTRRPSPLTAPSHPPPASGNSARS